MSRFIIATDLSPASFAMLHCLGGLKKLIAKIINIPLDELPSQEATLPKEKMIYHYCARGARAKMACNDLANAGFKVKFLRMNIKDLILAL